MSMFNVGVLIGFAIGSLGTALMVVTFGVFGVAEWLVIKIDEWLAAASPPGDSPMNHEYLIDGEGRRWCADDCPADSPHWNGEPENVFTPPRGRIMSEAQFPSDYEWALLDRWLKGLIDTNAEHEYEARLVMAIVERSRLVANLHKTIDLERLSDGLKFAHITDSDGDYLIHVARQVQAAFTP